MPRSQKWLLLKFNSVVSLLQRLFVKIYTLSKFALFVKLQALIVKLSSLYVKCYALFVKIRTWFLKCSDYLSIWRLVTCSGLFIVELTVATTHLRQVPVIIPINKVLVHLLHQVFTIDELITIPHPFVTIPKILHLHHDLGLGEYIYKYTTATKSGIHTHIYGKQKLTALRDISQFIKQKM